jgi:hypothetical protein
MGHVADVGEIKHSYRILDKNLEERRISGRCGSGWGMKKDIKGPG